MIVFEDRWLVIVDKPSGLPSQRTRRGERGVFEVLQDRYRYVALHHRLDRPVSGLMVVSKHRKANPGLAQGFAERTIQRSYQAVLYGRATDATWTWELDGKPASTHVHVEASKRGLTAVRVRLRTGRTHQIRRHASFAGTPLVGDRRYGEEAASRWPRIALHASTLSLSHPVEGHPLAFESPLPDDLVELWGSLT